MKEKKNIVCIVAYSSMCEIANLRLQFLWEFSGSNVVSFRIYFHYGYTYNVLNQDSIFGSTN